MQVRTQVEQEVIPFFITSLQQVVVVADQDLEETEATQLMAVQAAVAGRLTVMLMVILQDQHLPQDKEMLVALVLLQVVTV